MRPRRNIAATSLKVLLEHIYSVKSYDKNKHESFALSLLENFSWGLTYFDQFITTGKVYGEFDGSIISSFTIVYLFLPYIFLKNMEQGKALIG